MAATTKLTRLAPRLAPSSRARPFSSSRPPLVPIETVGRWVNDPSLVDPVADGFVAASQSIYRRGLLALMLRSLPGLDLPDFLEGARHAYGVTTRHMYRKNWDELEPMVAPGCLVAMQEAMEQLTAGDDPSRVVGEDEEGAITVKRAVLHQINIVDIERTEAASLRLPHRTASDDDFAPVLCHLDVRFEAEESFRIMECQGNNAVEPFDGRVRNQQSIWRFEGSVAPEDDEHDQGWRVFALV